MRYAISYGDGNNGLSRLHPNFMVEAPEGSEYILARLAMVSTFKAGHGKRWAARNLSVDEMGPDSAQAVIYDPPRSPGWSEHNGAWLLAEAYPASMASDSHICNVYTDMNAAFGRQLVAAHKGKE